MLTKEVIDRLKVENLPELYHLLRATTANLDIVFILENLGYLPDDFDGSVLLPFLRSSSDEIRFWAVKNLGKLQHETYLPYFAEIIERDLDSMVRREAVSSVGRIRKPLVIPVLLSLLTDADPKVVLQAVRGLLVFKQEATVQAALKKLRAHPNETIQAVIVKEFGFNGILPRSKHPHAESPDFMKDTIVLGDVRDTLRYVPDESVHLTFTSPPYYSARDYSIYASYQEYLDFLSDVFREVHRITKEGRFFILNTSPIIIPRVSRAYSSKRYPIPFDIHPRLVDMGWEFIDDIVWAKPEASVKNRNAGFLQHRKPLGYKPNAVTEYLMVYRKQTDRLLDWNIRQYDAETVDRSKVKGSYETTNLWRIDPKSDRVHSAVFPAELCHRIITYYSYVADLIFDPFGGSGTLGKAARDLGRRFFLTEKEPKYVERMREDLGGMTANGEPTASFLTLPEFAERRMNETAANLL
jgi:DNA modification methylase